MYEIYIGETKVMETVLPSYVYWDEAIGSFRTCDEAEAEAIYVTQEASEEETANYYADIDRKPHRHEGFPVSRIVKVA